MYVINIPMLLLISLITLLILLLFIKGASKEEKFIYSFIALGYYAYSGFGISYESVNNMYLLQYSIFLFCMLAPIKLINGKRIIQIGRIRLCGGPIEPVGSYIDSKLESDQWIYTIGLVVFLLSYFVYLLTPNFRVADLWNPPVSSVIGIHAKRYAEKNVIIKLADTLNIMTMPFFFVKLNSFAEKGKWVKYFTAFFIWFYLSYLQYCYLSRYQLMVFMMFFLFSIGIVKYGEIKLESKIVILIIVSIMMAVPFLASFTFQRMGLEASSSSFGESILSLIEGETYYPIYYDRILDSGTGLVSPLMFILWIICLPIPSIIMPGKPTIDPSFEFTKMLVGGNISRDAANYYNSLPSLLGESFLIFGESFYFIEAIVLGIVIGVFFRYFMQSKKLSSLTLYMAIMLVTLGRGGATSYMSVIINGSIMLILWIAFISMMERRRY